MPGFDINPAAGTQSLADPMGSGAVQVVKKKKGKWSGKIVVEPKGVNWRGKGAGSSSSGGGGASASKPDKNENKKKPPKKTPPEPYNPLYSPFLTPNELRAEAARLAALSVPSEESLRTTAGQQISGISGLTNALTGTLTGIAQGARAGLEGFGNLYSQLAAGAQSAGQSAAAAAGAPTSIAAGATPTMASNLLNLTAPTLGYAPAAAVTGAQMQGQVNAQLTKALLDRANTLSADTAKYLQQLKSDEIQRAISQGTLSQNAARLNLSGQQEAWNQKMDVASLGLRQQGIALQQQRIAQSIAKDLQRAGAGRVAKVKSAKDKILNNRNKFALVDDPAKTTWNLSYMYQGQMNPIVGVGSNESEAKQNAISKLSPDQQQLFTSGNASWVSAEAGKVGTRQATEAEIIATVVPILVNAGMKRANAIAWVRQNLVPAKSSGGTFLGGVGGTVV